jgi:hypothetical protein
MATVKEILACPKPMYPAPFREIGAQALRGRNVLAGGANVSATKKTKLPHFFC